MGRYAAQVLLYYTSIAFCHDQTDEGPPRILSKSPLDGTVKIMRSSANVGQGDRPGGLRQLWEVQDMSVAEWFVLESLQGCGEGSERV